MASTKHSKTPRPTDADLRNDPGIGTSKGKSRGEPLDPGENTFEGDVENDTTAGGGVDPRQRGRSNK